MNKILFSMTSFPERCSNCYNVIQSILNQKDIDQKLINIVLYFQGKKEEVPSTIYEIMSQYNNVYVECVSDKYRSYSKFIYAINNFKDYDIILLDDDIKVPENYISKYLDYYIENDIDTCYCGETKKIYYNEKYRLIYYDTRVISNNRRSRFLHSNSGHLTWYPKGYFSDNFIQKNIDTIYNHFPTSDELCLMTHKLLYKKYTQNIFYYRDHISSYPVDKLYTLFKYNKYNYFDYSQILTSVLDDFHFDWEEFKREWEKENI